LQLFSGYFKRIFIWRKAFLDHFIGLDPNALRAQSTALTPGGYIAFRSETFRSIEFANIGVLYPGLAFPGDGLLQTMLSG